MNNDILLKPFQLSARVELSNRVVMAPLTRSMAGEGLVPTQAMSDYYQRRSDAGLIISEATIIRADGQGYPNTPGIYSDAQITAWRQITDAVHERGGKMFLQLWHVGRVSHPDYLGGKLPISSSATEMKGSIPRVRDKQYGCSRAMTLDEIKQVIEDYATAANNAIKAGFDGVEIHGANGYLIDQFLHHHTNLRDDAYGGDATNMIRFALEVTKAVGESVGYDRTGIRLSPAGYINQVAEDMRDGDVQKLLLQCLNDLPIAYVHTGNFDDSILFESLGDLSMTAFLRKHFLGNVIASGSYSFESARKGIEQSAFDLVAIGRPFIANPDLMQRYKQQQSFAEYTVSMLEELV